MKKTPKTCNHNNVAWETNDLKECQIVVDEIGIPALCQDCGAELVEWYVYSNTKANITRK